MSNAHVPAKKSAPQIVALLSKLEGWRLDGDGDTLAIQKQFTFANFQGVMSFANAVAYLADRYDHHPEMLLTYRQCTVRLRTHDAGGITQKDFDSAARMDALMNL